VLPSLAGHKSPGIDGLPNELLRLEELSGYLLVILNKMLVEGPLIEHKSSLIIPIPKKGDLSDPANWRGICLMPHITKLYDRLLLNRIRDAIDSRLHPAQNGYRPGRGTTQHIMTLAMLRDISLTRSGFPVVGCFVDFSKAFDSVTWDAILATLTRWAAPPMFVQAVFSVMRDHVVRVRYGGALGSPIPVSVGVLQGDTLAPYLFVAVLDSVLCSLPEVNGIPLAKQRRVTKRLASFDVSVPRICALAYADDVVLLSESPAGLQHLLTAFEAAAFERGLRINMGAGKTECFAFDPGQSVAVSVSAGPVPQVSHYKYLGVLSLSPEKEFCVRKGRAWSSVSKFDDVWRSEVPLEVKRQLFRALVEPIFTYGFSALPLSPTQCSRVDGAYGRMLRYCLGLPPTSLDRSVRTEELYGSLPFLSTMLRSRRASMVGHCAREHLSGIRQHPLVAVLLADFSWLPFKRGQGRRITVYAQIMHDFGVSDPLHLAALLSDRGKCRAAVAKATEQAQKDAIDRLARSRERGYE
jgi:sorting nexin-29